MIRLMSSCVLRCFHTAKLQFDKLAIKPTPNNNFSKNQQLTKFMSLRDRNTN